MTSLLPKGRPPKERFERESRAAAPLDLASAWPAQSPPRPNVDHPGYRTNAAPDAEFPFRERAVFGVNGAPRADHERQHRVGFTRLPRRPGMTALCALPSSLRPLRTAAIPRSSHDRALTLGPTVARASAVRRRNPGRLSRLNWASGPTRPTTTRNHRNCQWTPGFARNPERKIISNSLRRRSLSRKRPWRFLENVE